MNIDKEKLAASFQNICNKYNIPKEHREYCFQCMIDETMGKYSHPKKDNMSDFWEFINNHYIFADSEKPINCHTRMTKELFNKYSSYDDIGEVYENMYRAVDTLLWDYAEYINEMEDY